MKKEKNDIKLWLFWFSLAVAIIAAYNILGNLAGVAQIIGSILGAIMPFCIGLLIAYINNIHNCTYSNCNNFKRNNSNCSTKFVRLIYKPTGLLQQRYRKNK